MAIVELLTELEHKTEKRTSQWKCHISQSLSQLLFKELLVLISSMPKSIPLISLCSLLLIQYVSIPSILLSIQYLNIPHPSLYASFPDTLHYAICNRRYWTASRHWASSEGRVSVSEQMNAFLTD